MNLCPFIANTIYHRLCLCEHCIAHDKITANQWMITNSYMKIINSVCCSPIGKFKIWYNINKGCFGTNSKSAKLAFPIQLFSLWIYFLKLLFSLTPYRCFST